MRSTRKIDQCCPAEVPRGLLSTDSVLSVAFSPDGYTLAAGSLAGKIWLWRLREPVPDAPCQPAFEPGHAMFTTGLAGRQDVSQARGRLWTAVEQGG
ncbi:MULTISPECIES: hypothetical protein [Pseudofrankia]|uniref:hypothetical protein n=1 Tax=Pseudofrankia TaxID=2994363 RepID=UPI000234CA50|nr:MULTISPECIES: hypothetical protein [Pseudofrankia]